MTSSVDSTRPYFWQVGAKETHAGNYAESNGLSVSPLNVCDTTPSIISLK